MLTSGALALTRMLDTGAGGAVVAGCDDISLHVRPPESLAGGFLSFGLAGVSQICVDFFGNGWGSRRWDYQPEGRLVIIMKVEDIVLEAQSSLHCRNGLGSPAVTFLWREIGIRQDGCTGEGRLEVVESSIAFLGPLEFAAFLHQSG